MNERTIGILTANQRGTAYIAIRQNGQNLFWQQVEPNKTYQITLPEGQNEFLTEVFDYSDNFVQWGYSANLEKILDQGTKCTFRFNPELGPAGVTAVFA